MKPNNSSDTRPSDTTPCDTTRALLELEALEDAQAALVATHVESCSSCQRFLEDAALPGGLEDRDRLPIGLSMPTDDEWNAVRTRLHAEPVPRSATPSANGSRRPFVFAAPLAAALLVGLVVFLFLSSVTLPETGPGTSLDLAATIEILEIAEGEQVMIYEPEGGVPMVWISSG